MAKKNIGSINILIHSFISDVPCIFHCHIFRRTLFHPCKHTENTNKKTFSLLERIGFQSIKEYNPQYKVYGFIPTDSKVVFKNSMVSIQ